MNTTKWVRFAYFHIQIIGSVMIARPAWFGGDERSGLFCTGSHWADPFANGCTDVFCEALVVIVVINHFFALRAALLSFWRRPESSLQFGWWKPGASPRGTRESGSIAGMLPYKSWLTGMLLIRIIGSALVIE
jgi:hypothetical protein